MIDINRSLNTSPHSLPAKEIQVWQEDTPQARIWVVIACGEMCIETLNYDAPYFDIDKAIKRAEYESKRLNIPFDGIVLDCDEGRGT